VTLAGADIALLVAAGLGAGTVNGVAGGGTLVSFPALLATGVPALQANVTSTLGIWPGYLGGVAGFRAEIKGQGRSMRLVGPAVGGAVVGSVLLLITPSSAFKSLAPYLVLLACLLFAAQPLIARWLRSSVATGADVSTSADVAPGDVAPHPSEAAAAGGRRRHFGVASVGTFLASVYGGYFGAGLGVVLLALLGLAVPDDLVRTNGLRAVLSLGVNTAAALVFLVAAHVVWVDAGLLAGSSLVGGYFGARVARKLPPVVFRSVVIALGLITAGRLLAG
jgi:uncharacterized membrane protein YfcA